MPEHMNLLIKPASSLCNLRCEYCFYHDSAKNREVVSYGIMSIETLENLLIKAFEYSSKECTIAFQGGEPTLAGLDFYNKYIEIVNKHNKKSLKINHAIQTNGTLIDEDWAKFLKENNFLVGVSLDGPKDCHDAFRFDTNDKGSYNSVMKGISHLEKHKVDYNILCVVNSVTAKKIQSIYNFYKKNNFEYLQFIPCIQPFGEHNSKMPFSLSSKDYSRFMCTLFDLWYKDIQSGQATHMRDFENYIEMLLGYPPESCGKSGICSAQYVIEADGGCYPCDFYVLDKYKLGNVNEQSFKEIDDKRLELKFIENSAKIPQKCRECKYFRICRGGCKRYCEPFAENEERDLHLLCDGYYQFFEHCADRLVSLARQVARK